MGFNITEFTANISSGGVANASNFKVIMSPPGSVDLKDLTMRCEQVDFPGRNINFIESTNSGMPFKVAMSATQPEINVSIILSSDFREKIKILEWQDKIVGPYRNGQIAANMFNIKYYDDYKGKVSIIQYKDQTDEVAYTCDLIDAYPASVGVVTGSWLDGNIIHKIPVTFVYRYFTDKIGE